MELGKGWRDGMTPLEDAEIFDSFEDAREKYPILRPKDDAELLEMLKGMDDA